MTDVTPATADSPRPMGLFQRVFGVVFSPRAAYTAVAARPAVLGALIIVILLNGGLTYWMLGSETGQRVMSAQVEERMRQAELQGQTVPPEQRAATQRFLRIIGVAGGVAQVVFTPVFIAILAAIFMGVLNMAYGDQRSYKHLFAIVAHSNILIGLLGLLTTPLMLAKGELSSPSRLSVLLPMLPEDSFVTHLLGAIDLVWVWALINLSIGLAVLYKRKTGPLATSLLSIYGGIALLVAIVRSIV